MVGPVVDRLENDLKGQAHVVRLEIKHPISAEVAENHQVRLVPTLLVFNGQGLIVFRHVGIPDPEKILKYVQTMGDEAEP